EQTQQAAAKQEQRTRERGKGPGDEARALEAQARAAGKGDEARVLWVEASQRWREALEQTPRDAFAASRLLGCGRKAGLDADLLAEEALALAARFPEDGWVRGNAAWAVRDQARAALRGKRPADALAAVERGLELAAGVKDRGLLLGCLLGNLKAVETAAGELGNGRAHTLRVEVARVLAAHAELLQHDLPDQAEGKGDGHRGGDDGERRLSPRERFFYLVRRLADAGLPPACLERLMTFAHGGYPDNVWFAQGWIQAARLRGDRGAARLRGHEAFTAHPEAWAVALERARVEEDADDRDKGIHLLEAACLQSREVWPWHELALMLQRAERLREAAEALAIALSHHRVEDAPKVWRLHLERAKLLAALGGVPGACEEAWLAAEARERGGFAPSRELERLELDEMIGLLDCEGQARVAREAETRRGLPAGAVRKRARDAYRFLADEALRRRAVPAEVVSWDEGRPFGFVETAARERVFVLRKVTRGRELRKGDRVRVVAVDGWDRKKQRPSRIAAWVEVEQGR
ncbi:MAG TPA: hypothetical protein P5076_21425, partial [Myxococcota bacterium]|nr:hypothetical protein [Myxococcota bacterium]